MKRLCKLGSFLLCAFMVTGCSQQTIETVSPVNVKVVKMERVPLSELQEYSGTIEEVSGSELSFSVAGTVKEIKVSQGHKVHKDDLIATLDNATAQNSYDVALATLSQAEDAYRRMKSLYENNSLPEIKWIEVQSKYKQAIAAEQIAKKMLNDCKLYAPFSGVISTKKVEAGQNVMPGVPVVKLVKTEQVKVKIAVPENEIANIQIGQAADIKVPALNNTIFEGKVVEKGISANPLSRSYEVKAMVDNKEEGLMPGMICQLYLGKEEERTVYLLPNRIVQIDENNCSFVWINNEGKAQKRVIIIGDQTTQGIIVEKGLYDNDEVIVEGGQKVSEGTQITVI